MRKLRRTVCRKRLVILRHCLPRHYREQELLYFHLQQEVAF
jgi:hypothetical protein